MKIVLMASSDRSTGEVPMLHVRLPLIARIHHKDKVYPAYRCHTPTGFLKGYLTERMQHPLLIGFSYSHQRSL